MTGALYNLTPYTWTKVAQASPATCYGKYADGTGGRATSNCWDVQEPAATIAPGSATGYTVLPNVLELPVVGNLFSTKIGYDAWVTYRVDVLGGPAEYMTFTVSQCWCTFTYGSSYPALEVWNTTAPPPAGYDPGPHPNVPPATPTARPQITYSQNVPYLFDQSFQIAGNYTVDASTDLGAPFVSVLNTICGSNASACSFTQTSPLVWGVGAAVKSGIGVNCTVTQTATRGSPPAGAVGEPEPPPLDPDWFEVEYEAAQSATLTVGGGLTLGAEFNLFGVVGGKISVEVEAEHEWQEVKTFTRGSKVFLPDNNIGQIWMAPVEGKVTGTLVVSNGSATFTATNFSETRSGVTKGPLTPAFNVITKIRPMTASEFKENCGNPPSGSLGRGAPKGKSLLRAARARVKRGQTEARVLRELGQPLVERFTTRSCRARDVRCDAIGGRGGTWVYRGVFVVFGANDRARALIYSTHGHRRMVMV